MPRKSITPEKLYHLYWEEKLSSIDIAKMSDYSDRHITRLLKKYKIRVRTRSQARREALKQGKLPHEYHEINETFFKSWSPEMAYVLGLYATDGCISELHGTKTITLASVDLELLQKIQFSLSSTYPIRNRSNNKNSNIYVFSFANEEMFQDLLDLGVTPRKSLTIAFPNVPSNYIRHYIRGVFDGDGSVGIEKKAGNRVPRLRVTFTSASRDFIYPLNESIHCDAGVSLRKIYKYGNAYRLIYLGEESLSLFYYLYHNVPEKMYLERKYNKFKEWILKWGKREKQLKLGFSTLQN
jgi:hypothetical protein